MTLFKDILKDTLDIYHLVSTPMHQGKGLTGQQQEASALLEGIS
jgi:ribosomal protein S12 methylthiotransferase accessory factor YcaO